MNGQVVLCKGVNDGKELERTIQDLMKYMPIMESVSVVPVGLSKHRKGLYPLEPFTKEDAIEVLDLIHHYQKICFTESGLHFIHASDEWYLLAERELPPEESYDGYLQLENGVGMLRLLQEEFYESFQEMENSASEKITHVSVATGILAAPILEKLCQDFQEKFPQIQITVYPIINHFFGEQITVSGLITGQDLIAQLEGKKLGKKLLIPCNMLRREEQIFLDDITLKQAEESLQVSIRVVSSEGKDLLYSLLET